MAIPDLPVGVAPVWTTHASYWHHTNGIDGKGTQIRYIGNANCNLRVKQANVCSLAYTRQQSTGFAESWLTGTWLQVRAGAGGAVECAISQSSFVERGVALCMVKYRSGARTQGVRDRQMFGTAPNEKSV